MKSYSTLRLLILLCGITTVIAQTANAQNRNTEEWIESILANTDEDAELDLNTVLEQIEYYRDRPFDINKVSRDQLSDLFFLTDLEIESIINHREKYGDYLDLLELQSVERLPLVKIRLLSELASVSNLGQVNINQGLLRDQTHELYIKWRRTLESQRGYTPESSSPYLGDPNTLYTRYKYKAGQKLQFGFTAEKDAGEEFFTGSNPYGFDYYSGHLEINKPIGAINKLILGDYSLSIGQGLIAFMGFGSGKSSQVMNVKNRTRILRPYTSVSEFNFLRGAAVDFKIASNLDLLVFGSYQKRDANFFLDTINDNVLRLYTSVPSDGFHRNENEIRKENQLDFTDAGASLRYRFGRLKVNGNFMYSSFGNEFNTDPSLYQLFSVLQQTYINGSLDYSYIWRNINLFGETSSDRQGDMATVNGAIIGLDKNLEMAVVYRNISRAYQSLYSNSFTESSTSINEEGIYVSALLRLSKKMEIQGYADFFRHPWLRFRIDSPSFGREYYLKFLYHQKRKSDTYIQYFFEQKEQNLTEESVKTTRVVPTIRHRLRFHNSYKLNPSFEIRNRVEFSFFEKADALSRGFMLYQDLIYRPKELPISAIVRYAIFDTDDFDSRIYAYENDLLYEFSIPAYANRGFRTYFNLRYRVNRNITAEARISRTYLNDRETIGSGNQEINGNTRTDFKAQLRFKF